MLRWDVDAIKRSSMLSLAALHKQIPPQFPLAVSSTVNKLKRIQLAVECLHAERELGMGSPSQRQINKQTAKR